LTSGGSVVTFTDNGSGAPGSSLHYRHNTGVTELAHIIYIGNEDIKCRAGGWAALVSTTGIKIDVSTTIMNIAFDGTITTGEDGGPDGVTNNESGISPLSNVATLSKGEGNVVYCENETNTTNIRVKKILIGFNITT